VANLPKNMANWSSVAQIDYFRN